MATQAAKRRQLFSFVAVCVLAALGAAPPADASRTLLASLTPDLTAAPRLTTEPLPPARSFDLLTAADAAILTACSGLDEAQREQLLERMRAQKLASGVFDKSAAHISLWGYDLSRKMQQGVYFLQPDPLGPVDSPNLYQAFGFDALNVTDPFGLATDYNFPPASPMQPKPMPIAPVVPQTNWLKDAAVGFEGMTAFDLYSTAAVHWFGDEPGLPRRLKPAGQGTTEGTFTNGIKNWPGKARGNAQNASDLLGISLQPIWNPTAETLRSSKLQQIWATIHDIAQVGFVNKQNVLDATTKEVLADVRARLTTQETTALVGHSQGGAINSSVAHHLTLEERARVDVVTIGGAAWGLPEGMRSVTMHVNTRDLVAMLTGGGMTPLRELLDRNENTRIVYYSFGELGNFETTHGVDVYLEGARTQGGSATLFEAEVIRGFLDGKGMDSWAIGQVNGVGR